jgi:hypothetical protein
VDKQLNLIDSPIVKEKIIHTFSDVCTDKIINAVKERSNCQEFYKESEKLKALFQPSGAWKKMNANSKIFLISAKTTFNSYLGLKDKIDYSGVCLLVTKALEVEVGIRFCKNFEEYLQEKYPCKEEYKQQFPTGLWDEKYNKPLDPGDFTLGCAAYILCFKYDDNISPEEKENNKVKLIEYAKARLCKKKSADEIFKMLTDYAKDIDNVRKEYRNPAAHTGALNRQTAEACFDLVVDVQKLLKRMLDSFDKY